MLFNDIVSIHFFYLPLIYTKTAFRCGVHLTVFTSHYMKITSSKLLRKIRNLINNELSSPNLIEEQRKNVFKAYLDHVRTNDIEPMASSDNFYSLNTCQTPDFRCSCHAKELQKHQKGISENI